MPDYEYRQTVVTLRFPLARAPRRSSGPSGAFLAARLESVYQAVDPDGEAEAEQTLPPLSDGRLRSISDPRVEAKRTQPPPATMNLKNRQLEFDARLISVISQPKVVASAGCEAWRRAQLTALKENLEGSREDSPPALQPVNCSAFFASPRKKMATARTPSRPEAPSRVNSLR